LSSQTRSLCCTFSQSRDRCETHQLSTWPEFRRSTSHLRRVSESSLESLDDCQPAAAGLCHLLVSYLLVFIHNTHRRPRRKVSEYSSRIAVVLSRTPPFDMGLLHCHLSKHARRASYSTSTVPVGPAFAQQFSQYTKSLGKLITYVGTAQLDRATSKIAHLCHLVRASTLLLRVMDANSALRPADGHESITISHNFARSPGPKAAITSAAPFSPEHNAPSI
jgi:hypothetical protein